LAALYAAEVGEGNFGTFLREALCDGLANSFGCARDEGDFTVK